MAPHLRALNVAHKKPHLPTKTCATCGLEFAWRKKWDRDWDTVLYCSERCRREAAATRRASVARPERPS